MRISFLISLALVALSGFVSQASGQTCSAQQNCAYSGNQIGFFQNVNSFVECCAQCARLPFCQTWTWQSNRCCFLYRGVGSLSYSFGSVSGVRPTTPTTLPPIFTTTAATVTTTAATITTTTTAITTTTTVANTTAGCLIETGFNYFGNDIGGAGNVLSISDCCTLCGRNPSCNGFAYVAASNYCFYKSALANGNRVVDGTITSGFVTVRG